MTQPCTNWLRPPKGKEESQHPEMKKRMRKLSEIENREIENEVPSSNEDYYNQILSEVK